MLQIGSNARGNSWKLNAQLLHNCRITNVFIVAAPWWECNVQQLENKGQGHTAQSPNETHEIVQVACPQIGNRSKTYHQQKSEASHVGIRLVRLFRLTRLVRLIRPWQQRMPGRIIFGMPVCLLSPMWMILCIINNIVEHPACLHHSWMYFFPFDFPRKIRR